MNKLVKILLILSRILLAYFEALYKRFVPDERKSIRGKVSISNSLSFLAWKGKVIAADDIGRHRSVQIM